MSNISMARSKPLPEVPSQSSQGVTGSERSELSELDNLKIENHKLKAIVFNLQQQLANANARITGIQLQEERAHLEQQFGKVF